MATVARVCLWASGWQPLHQAKPRSDGVTVFLSSLGLTVPLGEKRSRARACNQIFVLLPFPERGVSVSPFRENGCLHVCDAVGRGPRIGAEGACAMERICDVPWASLESFSLLVSCGVTLSVAGDCRPSLGRSFPSPPPAVLVHLHPGPTHTRGFAFL